MARNSFTVRGIRPASQHPMTLDVVLDAERPPQNAGAFPESHSDGVDVQRDAGAERGRHRTLLDVTALRARRLEADDLLERCADVLVELLSRERRLAHDEVHVLSLIHI